MAFDIVQMVYWLFLSAWFGQVLFGAMASPAIFKTVHDADPTLPTVLSVNLDGQHGALLAMTINAQILSRLLWLQLFCAGGLVIAVGIQWVLTGGSESMIFANALRSGILIAAIGLLIYGWRSVWPRMAEQRKIYVDNADDPEVALPARDQLTKLYRESEVVQLALATVLSALILFSTSMGRTVVVTTPA